MFKEKCINNVDRSSLRAPWQHGPYKNKHIEQHKTRKTTGRNGHKLVFLKAIWNVYNDTYMYLWNITYYELIKKLEISRCVCPFLNLKYLLKYFAISFIDKT